MMGCQTGVGPGPSQGCPGERVAVERVVAAQQVSMGPEVAAGQRPYWLLSGHSTAEGGAGDYVRRPSASPRTFRRPPPSSRKQPGPSENRQDPGWSGFPDSGAGP